MSDSPQPRPEELGAEPRAESQGPRTAAAKFARGFWPLVALLGAYWLADRYASLGFIRLFQGTPLLMQLFLCFFGLALVGIETSPWFAAALALTLYTGAFLGEIWRGCIEAVPKGQWDAGKSLALGYAKLMRFVILPQAMRIAIPPTVGFLVQVVKGTALASIIGFVDLTKAGSMIANATLEPFLVYGLVGVIYFALCYPLSLASRRLERKYAPAH